MGSACVLHMLYHVRFILFIRFSVVLHNHWDFPGVSIYVQLYIRTLSVFFANSQARNNQA